MERERTEELRKSIDSVESIDKLRITCSLFFTLVLHFMLPLASNNTNTALLFPLISLCTPMMTSSTPSNPPATATTLPATLHYTRYNPAHEDSYVAAMRQLIAKELSEPYSIYVYRYFLYQWGEFCFLAMDTDASGTEQMVGVVISKLEPHRNGPLRGYIAMLAVSEEYRGKGIATKLVRRAIDAMEKAGADEIALETEITNTAAIKLYERLGFLRSKRLHRYYLNGNSAYRLVLYLKEGVGSMRTSFDPFGPPPDHAQAQAHLPPPPVPPAAPLLNENGEW